MIDRLARAAGRDVSRETLEKLETYAGLLVEENNRQNLIAGSTVSHLWERHIMDSAQLVRWEPRDGASWVDIGSGAGIPGIVIACLAEGPVTLVEPRRLRTDFLHRAIERLRINARVVVAKAERAEGHYEVITGRAVASLSKFLEISAHLSTRNTVWALPKGRNARAELAEATRTWQGVFHVEQSITDPESGIVIAQNVRPKT